MFAKTKEIDPSFWMIKRKELKLWKWLHSDILQNPVKCSDGCPMFNVTCSLSGKDRVESILFYHQRCSNYITHTITFFLGGVHTLKGLSPTDYYVWESVERRQWRERHLWEVRQFSPFSENVLTESRISRTVLFLKHCRESKNLFCSVEILLQSRNS